LEAVDLVKGITPQLNVYVPLQKVICDVQSSESSRSLPWDTRLNTSAETEKKLICMKKLQCVGGALKRP
jgi:hypothetical protein